MRKWLIFIALFICGCSNELDITGPDRTSTVVYGLLSPQDSVHVIRLERSFITEGKVDKVAKTADSIYYSNAEVYLEIRTPNGFIIDRKKMEKVPLADRPLGTFASSSNRAYYCSPFDAAMSGTENNLAFTLTVWVPDLENAVLAQSTLPPKPALKWPDYLKNSKKISLSQSKPLYIPRQEYVYAEFSLIFRYMEFVNGLWRDTSFLYVRRYAPGTLPVVTPDKPLTNSQKYDSIYLDNNFLLYLIDKRIKDDPLVQNRRFSGIDFNYRNADPVFWDYQHASIYSIDINDFNYSNLKGAYGLFAAFNTMVYTDYLLDYRSMDSLMLSPLTSHLKFVSW